MYYLSFGTILLIVLLKFYFSNCYKTFNWVLSVSFRYYSLGNCSFADIFWSRVEGTNDTLVAHPKVMDGGWAGFHEWGMVQHHDWLPPYLLQTWEKHKNLHKPDFQAGNVHIITHWKLPNLDIQVELGTFPYNLNLSTECGFDHRVSFSHRLHAFPHIIYLSTHNVDVTHCFAKNCPHF